MSETPNKYGGKCPRCGQWVAEGKGTVASVWNERLDRYQQLATHVGQCPEPPRRRADDERPKWAVYLEDGSGVYHVEGAKPDAPPGHVVPVNDAARRIYDE